jgi:hypothetical protein
MGKVKSITMILTDLELSNWFAVFQSMRAKLASRLQLVGVLPTELIAQLDVMHIFFFYALNYRLHTSSANTLKVFKALCDKWLVEQWPAANYAGLQQLLKLIDCMMTDGSDPKFPSEIQPGPNTASDFLEGKGIAVACLTIIDIVLYFFLPSNKRYIIEDVVQITEILRKDLSVMMTLFNEPNDIWRQLKKSVRGRVLLCLMKLNILRVSVIDGIGDELAKVAPKNYTYVPEELQLSDEKEKTRNVQPLEDLTYAVLMHEKEKSILETPMCKIMQELVACQPEAFKNPSQRIVQTIYKAVYTVLFLQRASIELSNVQKPFKEILDSWSPEVMQLLLQILNASRNSQCYLLHNIRFYTCLITVDFFRPLDRLLELLKSDLLKRLNLLNWAVKQDVNSISFHAFPFMITQQDTMGSEYATMSQHITNQKTEELIVFIEKTKSTVGHIDMRL